MVCGSIFHFHQSPRLRPTRYAEDSRFSIKPSTPLCRASLRRSTSAGQLSASSTGDNCHGDCAAVAAGGELNGNSGEASEECGVAGASECTISMMERKI